jgi:hypothetical protein
MNFVPSPPKEMHAQPISFSLNIDGDQLAHAVIDKFDSKNQLPDPGGIFRQVWALGSR